MSPKLLPIIYYLLLWGSARVRGSIRRWRQPLLRGQDWFFKVHVQPGFYDGPGRKILHRYWSRIFASYLIEVPLTIAIFVSGHYGYLMWLILGMAAFIHVFHVFSVDMTEQQARQFAVAEAEQPVATIALSLKTRRLRDYTNRGLEVAIALSSILAFIWLGYYYVSAPEHHHFREVFAAPLFWLYAQLGFLLAKLVIVAWRAPIPQTQVEEHLAAREETRKLYIKACDRVRVLLSIGILSWPILLSVPPAIMGRVNTIQLTVVLLLGMVLGIWQEIRRKRLLDVTLRARPVKFPELLGQSQALKWPLCYQPSVPMIVLKGVRGYSLNLANQLTQLGAAYLAGLFVLLDLLRIGH